MNALPQISAEARTAALEKARVVRKERAEVKEWLKKGTLTLAELLKAEGDVIGKMPVSAVLRSLPGVGKVGALAIMARIGIAETRRVSGLGANQRAALIAEFAGA